jgi:RNA polymerase sigma-54 factor
MAGGMHLGASMQMRTDLKQVMAQRMYQSMKILQMTTLDLQAQLEQELQENPMLELKDPADPDAEPPEPEDQDPGAGELIIRKDGKDDFARLDAFTEELSRYSDEDRAPLSERLSEQSDRKHEAMQNTPGRLLTLYDHLVSQLGEFNLDERQTQLLLYLLTHLDQDGWLGYRDGDNRFVPYSLDELAAAAPVPVTPDELDELLGYIQELDPPGVGARDLKECLLLQLSLLQNPHRDLVRQLILYHLDDIHNNRLPAIQRRTQASLAEIHQAIEVLQQLNPRPGRDFSHAPRQYVTPDVIVDIDPEGKLIVQLVEDWIPNVGLSNDYRQMLKSRSTDKSARDYLRKNLQKATWLLEAIEQRRHTLERVTRAIIEHQREFLEHGPDHIKPLKMQQIAEQLNIHAGTVSRAVDEKWVQTPRGLFPLRRFFCGGRENKQTGEEVAWEVLKRRLLELINQEDKTNPLSDEELVERFKAEGHEVARRTITKYRKMLGIPSSRERKVWN